MADETPDGRFRERRSAFKEEPEPGAPEPAVEPAAEPPETAPEGGGRNGSPEAPAPEPSAAPEPPAPAEAPPSAAAAMPYAAEPAEPAALEPDLAEPEPHEDDPLAADFERLARMEIPPASFLEIVQPLEIQALQFLGEIPLTEDGERRILPQWARHVIDLLGILEERTRGNLPEEERAYLEQLLVELRTRYLKVAP